MVSVASRQAMTADEIDQLPDDGLLRELVHGELREWMSPDPEHGQIEGDLYGELRTFIQPRKLGVLMVGEVRFFIDGDQQHYRLADVAFVAAGKYPGGRAPRKADATTPDFVAEIISASDPAWMVQEKMGDWIAAGARLIWLVYPGSRQVIVAHPDGTMRTVPHTGMLDGGDVFPGLELPVSSFLP